MSFPQLPNFNLTMKVWKFPNTPAITSPDLTGIACQVYFNSRGLLDTTDGSSALWVPPIFIRVPLGVYTPNRGDVILAVGPVIEYYVVTWAQVTHKGFPNAYLTVMVSQCNDDRSSPRTY